MRINLEDVQYKIVLRNTTEQKDLYCTYIGKDEDKSLDYYMTKFADGNIGHSITMGRIKLEDGTYAVVAQKNDNGEFVDVKETPFNPKDYDELIISI